MKGKRPRDGWRGEQHETNGKIETRSENAVVLTSTLPAVIAIAFSSRKFGFSLFYVCLVWPGLGRAGPCLRLFILFFPHFVFFSLLLSFILIRGGMLWYSMYQQLGSSDRLHYGLLAPFSFPFCHRFSHIHTKHVFPYKFSFMIIMRASSLAQLHLHCCFRVGDFMPYFVGTRLSVNLPISQIRMICQIVYKGMALILEFIFGLEVIRVCVGTYL